MSEGMIWDEDDEGGFDALVDSMNLLNLIRWPRQDLESQKRRVLRSKMTLSFLVTSQ